MNSGAVAKAVPRRSFEARQLPAQLPPDLAASARRAPISAPGPTDGELVGALADEMIDALPKYRPIFVCRRRRDGRVLRYWLPLPAAPPLLAEVVRIAMLDLLLELVEAEARSGEARRTPPRDQLLMPFTECELIEVLRARGQLVLQGQLPVKAGEAWA